MDKKIYFETLRKSLAARLSIFDSDIVVSYNLYYSEITVTFPPKKKSLSYVILDTIRLAGGNITVEYYGDHMEVIVHVLYCE